MQGCTGKALFSGCLQVFNHYLKYPLNRGILDGLKRFGLFEPNAKLIKFIYSYYIF